MSLLRAASRLRLQASLLHRSSYASTRHIATMASTTDIKTYKFNHTMIRVKDPKESVKFYELLGMKLLTVQKNPAAKFDLYFLAYDHEGAVSEGRNLWDRQGVVELTHNYGTESDPSYKINNGNAEPHRGFGHLCITVDDLEATCKKIDDAGYKFQKKPSDGRMRHIAFALDPDGYWMEIVSHGKTRPGTAANDTDTRTYRMNHSMIRVKDPEKSLKFYQDVLGMTLLRESRNDGAGFSLYFLGYYPNHTLGESTHELEGLLELTWNHGTEKDESFSYHNGNAEPQGFGHVCVTVDNMEAACERFESMNVNWKKRLTDGRMHNIAFVLDPDNYWVEVVGNEAITGVSNF